MREKNTKVQVKINAYLWKKFLSFQVCNTIKIKKEGSSEVSLK